MGTWTRGLEITVISGEDLRIRKNRLVKKNAFVIIRTDSNNQEQRSRIDKEGGSHPAWNEKLAAIELPFNARFITVEVHCKMSGGVCKFIGAANIPVTDFVGGLLPENYLHILSYRLRNRDGGKNGIINLSLKVNNNCPHYNQGFDAINYGGKITNGVGIGIPVNFK